MSKLNELERKLNDSKTAYNITLEGFKTLVERHGLEHACCVAKYMERVVEEAEQKLREEREKHTH